MGKAVQGRQFGIDVLRLVCALLVVFYHLGFRGHAGDGLQDIGYPEIAPIAQYGWIGVEIFFLISGYVIYDSVRDKSIKDFLYGRFVRIYPTLWACAAITILVVVSLGAERFFVSPRDVIGNVVLWIPFGSYSYHMVDGVYWSLVYEVKFYAMMACIVWLAGKDRILECLLGVVVLNALVQLVRPNSSFNELWLCGGYIGFFGIGCALRGLQQRGAKNITAALLVASMISAAWYTAAKIQVVEDAYRTVQSSWVIFGALSVAALVIGTSHQHGRVSPWFVKASLFAGGMTYPLYLLHQNIGYTLLNTELAKDHRGIALAVSVGTVIALAALVYVFIDKPVRRVLMEKWSARAIGASVEL